MAEQTNFEYLGNRPSSPANFSSLLITSTDPGAAGGPTIDAYRNSASPAAADLIGDYVWSGQNSTPAKITYGFIEGRIDDPTAGTEDAALLIGTRINGSLATRATVGNGLTIGNPTGGDQGAGTLNTSGGVFLNGVSQTPTSIPVRQTVLAGSVDINGLANFITTGSGLQAGLLATTVPVVVAAARGTGQFGAQDRLANIVADANFPAARSAVTISTLTRVTTTATLTTTGPHGLATGAEITVSGTTPATFGGTYLVTVTGANTLTYVMPTTPTGNATVVGAYTVTNFLYCSVTTIVPQAISSITRVTTTATLTTSSPHLLVSGASVTVAGATPSQYNGTFVITVTGPSAFTYTMGSDPGSSASPVGAYTVANPNVLGVTSLPPVYQPGGTFSAVAGQFTFNVNQMIGTLGDGSSANAVALTFLGEVQAASAALSGPIAYAIAGSYAAPFTATLPGNSVATIFNHNIGSNEIYGSMYIELENTTIDAGWSVGDRVRITAGASASVNVATNWGFSRIVLTWPAGNSATPWVIFPKGGGVAASLTLASWKFRAYVNRGW